MSIRGKILLWFLPSFILTGIIVGGIVYYYISKTVKQNIYDQLEMAADALQENLHAYLEGKKGRTIDFGSDGFIRVHAEKIINGIDVDPSTFQLNRHLLYNKKSLDKENILEVFVVDLDGKVISSTENSRIGQDISGELYFSRTRERGSFISDLHYSPEIKQNTFEVSVLITANEGMRPIGMIVNRYRGDILGKVTRSGTIEELGQIKRLRGLGETGELYIVNKDKLMITGSRFIEDAILKQVVDTEGVKTTFDNGVGMTGIYINYRGIPILGVSRYVGEMGWVILAEKDVSEAFVPIMRLRNIIIIMAVMGIMAIVAIAIFLSKMITSPIQKLVEGTRKISSGNLGFKITTRSKDEIGFLATSFNDMTSQLRESKRQLKDYAQNLEKKIEDKTKEIRQMLNELKYKNNEMEQIIYVTSHDLRSPLLNIQGFSRELQQSFEKMFSVLNESGISSETRGRLADILEEDIPDALRFILTSSSKMDTLLSGLLRLSRMGRASFDIKQLDMNKLISNVIETYEYKIKKEKVKTQVGELPSCKGDNVQINQVFSNLIDNALKYLNSNREGIIRISGRKGNGHIVYCLEDNGIGMAETHHDKVFEIFHRLNPGDSIAGEGLGLTIVRWILYRHGGKIWVESKPGKGSKFFVSLPG